jgi:hypothetical protein
MAYRTLRIHWQTQRSKTQRATNTNVCASTAMFKDLDTAWKKERTDLQKQLQHGQQTIDDLQKQLTNRDQPVHFNEKINVLTTENELLMNKIKDLEIVGDNVHLLKTEVQRLRDKNSSDWNYWRKQQSDLYAQLRQQTNIKESIFYKFDRLQKQVENMFD